MMKQRNPIRITRPPYHSYCKSVYLKQLLKEKGMKIRSPRKKIDLPFIGVKTDVSNNETFFRSGVAYYQLEPLTSEAEDVQTRNFNNRVSKNPRKVNTRPGSRGAFVESQNTVKYVVCPSDGCYSSSNRRRINREQLRRPQIEAQTNFEDIYDINQLTNQLSENEQAEPESPDCFYKPRYI